MYSQCGLQFPLQIGNVKAITLKAPVEWEPQENLFEIKPVYPLTAEWAHIHERLSASLPLARLIRLDRIQNWWLWERYAMSQLRMEAKNCGVVNEMELFHGSRHTKPETIFRSEQGFDFRFARHEGLWGAGIYFAVNASYLGLLAKILTQINFLPCCLPVIKAC